MSSCSSCEIEQLPGQKLCQWHRKREGQTFKEEDILPNGVCPWLYHTLYPYFLAFLYGAKFDFNEEGDVHVSCPAVEGVNTIVRKRDNDGTFDPRIGSDMKFVIFGEVVKVKGHCPYGHKEGDRILFPTCMPQHYMCPAAFNNIFPFLDLEPPSCIDKDHLRCPDWLVEIGFRV